MTVNVSELAGRLAEGMDRAVVDAQRTAFALTVALLARGHALIEGVPGTGKTLAVRALAVLLGVEFRRIQFTPDMMPADVVGTTVFNPKTTEFSTRLGPIVANVVLADEINRTPPKTQAALLEAMEEGCVTIDGVQHRLPSPFLLCATQNPIEYEGTYPLPEAQLDRFMIKIESTLSGRDARTGTAGTRCRRVRRARAGSVGHRGGHQCGRSDRSATRDPHGAFVGERAGLHVSRRGRHAQPSALDAGRIAARGHRAAAGIAGRCGDGRPRVRDPRRRKRRGVRRPAASPHRGARRRDRRDYRFRRSARDSRDGSSPA